MTTYSTQFAAVTLSANNFTNLYTVPAGDVVVVRDIEVYFGVPTSIFNFQVGAPGSTTIAWYIANPASNTWQQWGGRVVVPAGQSLWAYSVASSTQLIVSGYLLTAS